MKRLLKRFRSLEEDLGIFIKTELILFHRLGIDNKGVVRIAGLGIQTPRIYKARKFACRSLKSKGAQTGIRVIYAQPLFAKAGLKLDHGQCLAVDRFQKTNIEGVFAAGDISCGGMQVVTATGEGAMAAMQAIVYLRKAL